MTGKKQNIHQKNMTGKLVLIIYILKKKEYILPQNISCNSKHEKQVIFSMIQGKEKQHHLAVRKLSVLLRGITSKYNGDFYCLSCLHSCKIRNRLKLHKKVCETKEFLVLYFLFKILRFNQYHEFDKAAAKK